MPLNLILVDEFISVSLSELAESESLLVRLYESLVPDTWISAALYIC